MGYHRLFIDIANFVKNALAVSNNTQDMVTSWSDEDEMVKTDLYLAINDRQFLFERKV